MTVRTMATLAAVLAAAIAAGSAGATTPPKAARDGIVVHGNWTLVVRNKQHRIVRVRRFHNALTPDGASFLVNMLGGVGVPYLWSVALNTSTPAANACWLGLGNGCWISEQPGSEVFATTHFVETLTVSRDSAPELVLQGSIAAPGDATVRQVLAGFTNCPAAGACSAGSRMVFSAHDVSPGVPVTNGQTIAIKVVYTFS